jgi:chorismate mutase/prephenate dehydrogenase
MAELVVMELEEHDRLIAFVLGSLACAQHRLLHGGSPRAAKRRRGWPGCRAPPFDAQLDVASRVASENPDLYFEIQSLKRLRRGAARRAARGG